MENQDAINTSLREHLIEMTDEEMFRWMKDKTSSFQKIMAYYRCALMEVETKFNVLDVEYSLQHDRNPISGIRTRLKSPESIAEKLHRKGVAPSIDAVEKYLNDVAGIRVICSFPEDVYTLADAFLKQDDVTLIEKRDYIQHPKPSGYRSLHLIVEVPIFLENEKRRMKVEIQLRTIAMNCWAHLEHQLRYKKEREFTEQMGQDLMLCAQLSTELDLRMDALRQSIEEGRYIPYDELKGQINQ